MSETLSEMDKEEPNSCEHHSTEMTFNCESCNRPLCDQDRYHEDSYVCKDCHEDAVVQDMTNSIRILLGFIPIVVAYLSYVFVT